MWKEEEDEEGEERRTGDGGREENDQGMLIAGMRIKFRFTWCQDSTFLH